MQNLLKHINTITQKPLNWIKRALLKSHHAIVGKKSRTIIVSACLLIGAVGLTYVNWLDSQYHLTPHHEDLLGQTDNLVIDMITYDKVSQEFTLGRSGESDNNEDNINLPLPYSLTIDAKDGNVAIKDNDTSLEFSFKPELDLYTGRLIEDRIVFPLKKYDAQLVYTLTKKGIKEDLVLNEHIGDEVELTYKLNLPAELEAREIEQGRIGIFSADPTMFISNIQFATDEDRQLLENAMKNSKKDHLLFILPAPYVSTLDNNQEITSNFNLEENQVSITTSGLENAIYPLSIDPTIVLSNDSDFNKMNLGSGVSFTDEYVAVEHTGGVSGSWSVGSNLITARSRHVSEKYNGYVYAVGGFDGSNALDSVEFALVNANGSLGAWQTTSSLNTARYWFDGFQYNGYLYVVGGNDGSSYIDTIERAEILPDGALGPWEEMTLVLPEGRDRHKAVIHKGRIFVIGGQTSGATSTDSVISTDLMVDGTLDASWQNETSLLTTRRLHQAFVYNDGLYVLGGINASNSNQNSIHRINLDEKETIGSWSNVGTLDAVMYGFDIAIQGGYLYVFGGTRGATTYTADVRYSPLTHGDNFDIWRNSPNLPLTNRYHQIIEHQNRFILIGGEFSAGGVRAATRFTAPTPGVGSTSPIQLTSEFSGGAGGRYGAAAVVARGYVYMMGGCTGTGGLFTSSCNSRTDEVRRAEITNNGLNFWQTMGSLSAARDEVAAGVFGDYIYVVGGNSATSATTTVQFAQILNDSGALSSWSTTSSLNTSRARHGVVIYRDRIFAFGGVAGTTMRTSYEFATINVSNGTLSSWTESTSGSADFRVASDASYVVVDEQIVRTGGCSTAACDVGQRLDSVWAVGVASSGLLSGATQLASLPQGRFGHASFYWKGRLYIAGGSFQFEASSVQSIPISVNGDTGAPETPTTWTTHQSLGYSTWSPAYAQAGDQLFIMGGCTFIDRDGGSVYCDSGSSPGAFNSTSRIMPINHGSPGGVASSGFTSELNNTRLYVRTVKTDEHIYAIGGTGGLTSVEYAPINPDGTLGDWEFTSSMNDSRRRHAVAKSGDFIYVSGGLDVDSRETVEYAPINPDGTLGDWEYTTDLPVGRQAHEMVATDTHVYVMGGDTTSAGSSVNVWHAPINPDGTLGGWTTTGSFNVARGRYATEIVGNRIYVSGGVHNDARATVEWADVETSGIIRQWHVSPSAHLGRRMEHSLIQTDGFLVAIGGLRSATLSSHSATIEYAPLSSDGSLGRWQASPVGLNTSRYSHDSTVDNRGNIYTLAGSATSTLSTVEISSFRQMVLAGSFSFLIDTETDVFYDELIIDGLKQQDFKRINTTRRAFINSNSAATAGNGYVYYSGGGGISPTASVDFAPINADGSIGSWQPTEMMTVGRRDHAMEVYNGYIYALGGQLGSSSASAVSTVEYAPINPDGSLGEWQLNPTEMVHPRTGLDTTIHNGFIYAAGDINTRGIEYAPINEDGTIGTWQMTVSPGVGVRHVGITTYNSVMYVIGAGSLSVVLGNPQVYFGTIRSDGSIESFTQAPDLKRPRSRAATFANGGRLYAVSHESGSIARRTIESANILPDGSIEEWEMTSLSFPTTAGLFVEHDGIFYTIEVSGASVDSAVKMLIPLDTPLRTGFGTGTYYTAKSSESEFTHSQEFNVNFDSQPIELSNGVDDLFRYLYVTIDIHNARENRYPLLNRNTYRIYNIHTNYRGPDIGHRLRGGKMFINESLRSFETPAVPN